MNIETSIQIFHDHRDLDIKRLLILNFALFYSLILIEEKVIGRNSHYYNGKIIK